MIALRLRPVHLWLVSLLSLFRTVTMHHTLYSSVNRAVPRRLEGLYPMDFPFLEESALRGGVPVELPLLSQVSQVSIDRLARRVRARV